MLKNYSKIESNKSGTKLYLNDEDKNHHLDGPAVEYTDGSKIWFINGGYHRNIDPSVEWSDGRKYWLFKNKSHRVGGSFYSYSELWRINEENYTKQGYYNKVWDI